MAGPDGAVEIVAHGDLDPPPELVLGGCEKISLSDLNPRICPIVLRRFVRDTLLAYSVGIGLPTMTCPRERARGTVSFVV
jgi:hypothetical protein